MLVSLPQSALRNSSSYVFHFSVSVIDLELQPMGYLTGNFFHSFCLKIGSNVHLEVFFFFSKLSWFYRKMENINRFSIIELNIP